MAVREDETGEEETRRLVRFHSIFNVAQVSGLPERFCHFPPTHPLDEALLEAAAFIGAFGANARHAATWPRIHPPPTAPSYPIGISLRAMHSTW